MFWAIYFKESKQTEQQLFVDLQFQLIANHRYVEKRWHGEATQGPVSPANGSIRFMTANNRRRETTQIMYTLYRFRANVC